MKRTWPWLAMITVFGGVLRIIGLGTTPLWLDESYTAQCSQQILAEGVSAAATCDHISPGYYLLAALASAVTGNSSEFTMRLFAMTAGVLTIPAMALLAKRMLGNDRVVVAVALATAGSPLVLRYSQEARGYSLLLLLGVCYIILNWDLARKGPSLWRFVGIAFVAVGMIWLHLAALYLMVAAGLLMLWQLRITKWPLWAWAGVHLVAGLSYLPFAIETSKGLAGLVDNTLPGNPIPRLIFNTMAMVAGLSLGPTTGEVGSLGAKAAMAANLPGLALIVSALVGGLVSLWLLRRKVDTTVWWWLLVLLVVPNLMLIVSVFQSHVLMHLRYVITTWPVYGLLIGFIWANAGRRHVIPLVSSLLLVAVYVVSTISYFADPKYAREDITQLPSVLAEQMDPGDVLLIANDNAVVPMLVYGLAECPDNTINMRNVHAFDTLKATARAEPGGDTFVVLYRQWENAPAETLNAFLDETLAKPGQTWQWQGVELQRRPGRLVAEDGDGLDHGCAYDK